MAEPASAEEPSVASSPTASGSTNDTLGAGIDDMFIRHRIAKMDTLAGLAVKYNVTVSDIKRANGFQTDTAMFGKDTILIPTKPMPIGPEYAAWAGIIVAHYGKMPSSTSGSLRPTSAAALSELRGYYSTGPSMNTSPEDSDDDFVDSPWSRRKNLHGEVELMTRQQSAQNAPGYIEERLRRRRNGEDDGEDLPPGAFQSLLGTITNRMSNASNTSNNNSANGTHSSPWRRPLFRSATERHERSVSMGNGLQDLKDWHRKSMQWKDEMINKLKKVASQPALAPLGRSSMNMNQAADAAMASTARQNGVSNASNMVQHVQQSTYNAGNTRIKECPKAD